MKVVNTSFVNARHNQNFDKEHPETFCVFAREKGHVNYT